jgi:hypothetical protein
MLRIYFAVFSFSITKSYFSVEVFMTTGTVKSVRDPKPGASRIRIRIRNVMYEGTTDFFAQMCGIKFFKDDENLRPVVKKSISEISKFLPKTFIEWLLPFWTF